MPVADSVVGCSARQSARSGRWHGGEPIFKQTFNLRSAQAVVGFAMLEGTMRRLGVGGEDATTPSEAARSRAGAQRRLGRHSPEPPLARKRQYPVRSCSGSGFAARSDESVVKRRRWNTSKHDQTTRASYSRDLASATSSSCSRRWDAPGLTIEVSK